VIFFCDTSALMKLLVDKAQSNQMRQNITTVDPIGICRISWAETIAVWLTCSGKTRSATKISNRLGST